MDKYFNIGDRVYVAQAELFDNSLLKKQGVIKEIYKNTKRALISFDDTTLMERELELCVLEK